MRTWARWEILRDSQSAPGFSTVHCVPHGLEVQATYIGLKVWDLPSLMETAPSLQPTFLLGSAPQPWLAASQSRWRTSPIRNPREPGMLNSLDVKRSWVHGHAWSSRNRALAVVQLTPCLWGRFLSKDSCCSCAVFPSESVWDDGSPELEWLHHLHGLIVHSKKS